jgi:hypothetical protein
VQCDRFLEKKKEKILPEDDPVKLKHVINVYILMTCETL